MKIKALPSGTITFPRGFLAAAVCAGIKAERALDLGVLYSQVPAAIAGVFTANKVKAAPVILCQEHLAERRAQAIVVNSGCANAATGRQGLADAMEMANLTAKKLHIPPEWVMVASTGLIGIPLPMELIRSGIEKIALSPDGGHALSQAIMTTDTRPKEIALSLNIGGGDATIGGIAKGAGMLHPSLATLLCFLTTDAAVDVDFLQAALKKAVDASFNMLTVDGDTSPNDTVLILANGVAGNEPIADGKPAALFQQALSEVCLYLAKELVRDAEGATKLIEVAVERALSLDDAKVAARTIASSPLVKAAIHGSEPNWGRVLAALGRSGASFDIDRIELFLGNVLVFRHGEPVPFDSDEAGAALSGKEVEIRGSLNLGSERATAWGCDLSPEYVKINSEYAT